MSRMVMNTPSRVSTVVVGTCGKKVKRNRKLNSVVVLDICVQVNARNWIFTLGGKWICTAHGRVVDVNHVVVVGDLLLLIGGL